MIIGFRFTFDYCYGKSAYEQMFKLRGFRFEPVVLRLKSLS